MATRSEEQRVARWCMKHLEELEREGVDISAFFRVLIKNDPEAFPLPRPKGRRPGRVSRKEKPLIGSLVNISPKQFIQTLCWLIKLVNKPTNKILYIDNTQRYQNNFENSPKGFSKLMLALCRIIPDVEKKALFDLVKESFVGYNVGSYSTFMYHCESSSNNDCDLLATYIKEMDCDL